MRFHKYVHINQLSQIALEELVILGNRSGANQSATPRPPASFIISAQTLEIPMHFACRQISVGVRVLCPVSCLWHLACSFI